MLAIRKISCHIKAKLRVDNGGIMCLAPTAQKPMAAYGMNPHLFRDRYDLILVSLMLKIIGCCVFCARVRDFNERT